MLVVPKAATDRTLPDVACAHGAAVDLTWATIQARAAVYVADLWVHLRVGRNLRANFGSQSGPVAYVRTVFAVYEVACVTQPRLFLRCYEPRI